jgi:carbonic anhydrase/acetyltransferase-like protein (isoleucine patch superfamily)
MAIYRFEDRVPQIDPSAFVFDNACVIGLVTLGTDVSVWPYATLRGDNELIMLGAGSNVQEGAVLHTDPGCPLTVGANVTIGHQAVLHGCTVGDGSLIGIGAIVLNRAVIGANCLVGAGALVTEGKVIPDNSLVLGSPAKVVRELRLEDLAAMRANAAGYVTRAAQYRTALDRLDRP